MSAAEWMGSVGVALLLGAFAGVQAGWFVTNGPRVLISNIVGAAFAAVSSGMIGFMPFVVLESVWCVAAIVALIARFDRARKLKP